MFDIVRQDLRRCLRANQMDSTTLVAYDCLVFGNPGRVVHKMSAGRKLAKVGTEQPAGSVGSPSLATV